MRRVRHFLQGVPPRYGQEFKITSKFRTTSLFLLLALAAITADVFYPLLSHSYIYLDDTEYVFHNPVISNGFSIQTFFWAWRPDPSTYWQPLTWFSHLLDVQLFGLDPAGHHLSSLILHVLNSWLLFHFLFKVSDCPWRSFFVAAVFAIHPLQVESVAWIAERKTLLSSFFALLSLIAYASYGKEEKKEGYVFSLLFLAASLMAKSTYVILPLFFLLLDDGPFKRVKNAADLRKVITEKWPFVLIALLAFAGIFLHLKIPGLVHEQDRKVLTESIVNGFYSYLSCLGRFFRPVNLAPLYGYPEHLSILKTAAMAAGLIFVSGVFYFKRKSSPWLWFGWAWYLLTLLPVAGFVPIGIHAMTDHYMYLPVAGLALMVVWTVARQTERSWMKTLFFTAAVIGLSLFAVRSRNQLSYWKNSETLFRHILSISPENHLIYYNYGGYLTDQKRYPEAIENYRKSLEYFPDNSATLTQIGRVYALQSRPQEARYYLQEALELMPENTTAALFLGNLYQQGGNDAKAVDYYEYVLRVRPGHPDARKRLEESNLRLGKSMRAESRSAAR